MRRSLAYPPWRTTGEKRPAGRVLTPALTVTILSGNGAAIDEATLTGHYVETGRHHGRFFYEKCDSSDSSGSSKVVLYFWKERHGDEDSGAWWFGKSLGGENVWARNASQEQTPPRTNWSLVQSQSSRSVTLFVDRFDGTRDCAAAQQVPQRVDQSIEALRSQLMASEKLGLQREKRAKVAEDAERETSKQLGWALASPLSKPLHYTEFSIRELHESNPLFRFYAALVTDSCAEHRAELRSQRFCDPPQLQVIKLAVITNPRLLNVYISKAENIIGLRRDGCTEIPPLSHLKIDASRGVSAGMGIDVNEHFLFHGASREVVNKICKGGFDPRRGGEGVGHMFGVATYFAAHSSKSDIYTGPLPRQAERQLIIARALLGESHRALDRTPRAMRPPDDVNGLPLDSVWADTQSSGGAVDHAEVMIYDSGQAYPQVVVTYAHTSVCRCSECGKRPSA